MDLANLNQVVVAAAVEAEAKAALCGALGNICSRKGAQNDIK